jgi:hypothetical protein
VFEGGAGGVTKDCAAHAAAQVAGIHQQMQKGEIAGYFYAPPKVNRLPESPSDLRLLRIRAGKMTVGLEWCATCQF